MTIILGIAALLALLFVRTVPKNAHLVDGDTIDVRGARWRLAGFDAPEIRQPGGTEATTHLRHILSTSRKIAIVHGRDVYGRRLAHIVTLRGPLSLRMIASGNAHATGALGVPAMLFARIAGKGVWGMSHAVVAPKTWRAMHPRI